MFRPSRIDLVKNVTRIHEMRIKDARWSMGSWVKLNGGTADDDFTLEYYSWKSRFLGNRNCAFYSNLLCAVCIIPATHMLKHIGMGLRGFFLFAAKIWSFICYCVRRQIRAVSIQWQYHRFTEVITAVPSDTAILPSKTMWDKPLHC